MKMTKLEWKYLQKIALDHPFYDTHKPPLTAAEAKAIAEAHNRMTGREFVDSVYARLGMPRPIPKKERFEKLRSVASLFTVPPIRRIAIAVLAIVLMIVFFAATPVGRAIAESVIQYVVNLVENKAIVSPPKSKETFSNFTFLDSVDEVQIGYDFAEKFDSFESFSKETGKTPFTLSLPYERIYYESIRRSNALATKYTDRLGSIIVMQVWNQENDGVASSTTDYELVDESASIYCSKDQSDGSILYIRVLEDSIVYVHADKEIDKDYVLQLIMQD